MSKNNKTPLLGRGIPVWAVGLIATFGIVGTIAFGNVAIHAYKGGKKAGIVGDLVLTLSTLPDLWKKVFLNAHEYLHVKDDSRFSDISGFKFEYPAGSRPDMDYLLLSKWDQDANRSVVELWDLNLQSQKYRWEPKIDEIHKLANLESNEIDLQVDRAQNRMMLRHPFVLDDGSLIYKAHSPLVRVSACNDLIFQNDQDYFHHSTEIDADGFFWVPTRIEPTKVPFVDKKTFYDHAITKINQQGEIVYQRSVAELFIDKDLGRYVYGQSVYTDNPFHLNDIQPVLSDGPFWKRGDVFLSFRNQSMIVLFRPSTDEIVWFKVGPWMHQHDVDILDDYRISVFNNNSIEASDFRRTVDHSNILIYNFQTDEVTAPWDDVLEELEFATETEGLHSIRADGSILLEEQNSGRVLYLNPDKKMDWQFVNRADDGEVYRVGWSRMIDRATGDKILQAIDEAKCTN